MAGITDLPFRLICQTQGADILYSEMISANGLAYKQEKTFELLNSCYQDSPLVLQLFGSEPDKFAAAAQTIDQLPTKTKASQKIKPYRPAGIDINFGCPVKKVLKQTAGCALMKKPDLAYDIIKATCDHTSLPVSIKIRAGISQISALDFLEKVAELPWQSVMVHGRTFAQGFTGSIDYNLIKEIKARYPQKKVYANGGVVDAKSALEILEKTEADGLAIGRGALGKPWLFQEIKNALQAKPSTPLTNKEIKQIIQNHLSLVEESFGESGVFNFRKHLIWYLKNFPQTKKLRYELIQIRTLTELRERIDKIKLN